MVPCTLRWFCPRGQFWTTRINNNIVFALLLYFVLTLFFSRACICIFNVLYFHSMYYFIFYFYSVYIICIVSIGLANRVSNDVFRNIRIITLFSSQMHPLRYLWFSDILWNILNWECCPVDSIPNSCDVFRCDSIS